MQLDHLPPFITVNILDDIVLLLVYMFNRSLTEDHLPGSQKRTIVFPTVTQKSNLDLNVNVKTGIRTFPRTFPSDVSPRQFLLGHYPRTFSGHSPHPLCQLRRT